ncbi:hypothetical protein EYF80_011724 [Liparis tanakae]|uniref:Uncharacterized protein n=1 Tax=Liparis tanakae TaxID=230148 RepID=A0A4Z2IJN5_9TELE|nr:hypothetical protein EYF80_011724 [Liparis tanakae]
MWLDTQVLQGANAIFSSSTTFHRHGNRTLMATIERSLSKELHDASGSSGRREPTGRKRGATVKASDQWLCPRSLHAAGGPDQPDAPESLAMAYRSCSAVAT